MVDIFWTNEVINYIKVLVMSAFIKLNIIIFGNTEIIYFTLY